MGRRKESQDKEIKHPEEKVFWIVGLGLVTMLIVPAAFVVVFYSLEWGGPADWATFATYFSGIATPVVALCSALLFYRSIIVQRDEFDKTRREMQHSSELQHKTVVAQERSNKLMKLSEELKRKAHVQSQMEKAIARYADEKLKINQSFSQFLPRTRTQQLSLGEAIQKYGSEGLLDELPKKVDRGNFALYISEYVRVSIDLLQVMSKFLKNGGDVHTYRHLGTGIITERSSILQLLNNLNILNSYIETYNHNVESFKKLDKNYYSQWFKDS